MRILTHLDLSNHRRLWGALFVALTLLMVMWMYYSGDSVAREQRHRESQCAFLLEYHFDAPAYCYGLED